MINTTLNMRADIHAKLSGAAAKSGRSRRDVVSALMSHVVKKGWCVAALRGGVRYQHRIAEGRWRCLHIGVHQDEYEFFFDLKKVMKMSVSFIISWAIECFLDDFLNDIMPGADNYRFMNYAMYSVTIGNVFHIILCWGIPPYLIIDS